MNSDYGVNHKMLPSLFLPSNNISSTLTSQLCLNHSFHHHLLHKYHHQHLQLRLLPFSTHLVKITNLVPPHDYHAPTRQQSGPQNSSTQSFLLCLPMVPVTVLNLTHMLIPLLWGIMPSSSSIKINPFPSVDFTLT